jgi:hypothetical protein
VAFLIATAFSATVLSTLGWGEIGPIQKWMIATSSAIAPTAMPMKPIVDLFSSIDFFLNNAVLTARSFLRVPGSEANEVDHL